MCQAVMHVLIPGTCHEHIDVEQRKTTLLDHHGIEPPSHR